MSKTKILMIIVIFITLTTTLTFASLSAHPEQIFETVIKGQKNNITFHIVNVGPTISLSYQLSASETWISFNSISGEIQLLDSVEINLFIDATGLKEGIYKDDIVIGDPNHVPIIIPIEIFVSTVVDVNKSNANNSLQLQAFPNPFNTSAEIYYSLPLSQDVIINLIDINGSRVKSIANEFQTEGIHRINFDSSELPSGIYFIS